MIRLPHLVALVREWASRMGGVFHTSRADADLQDELQFHIELAEADAMRGEVTGAAARTARMRAGNVTHALEAMRDQRSLPWADDFIADLRVGWRLLGRSPGFVALAVLTLALGIGATTAMFTVADRLLFEPPPFGHSERLFWVYDVNPKLRLTLADATPPSPANFVDWRRETRSFDHMVAWRNWWFSIAEPGTGTVGRNPEQVRGVSISPAFFDMLGVRAAAGRTFRADEEQPGRDRVAVLTDGFWRRRFGADPGILGRTLLVDGEPRSIVGVLPPDFYFLWPDSAIFMPMTVDGTFRSQRSMHSIVVLGRLAPGLSKADGDADLARVARNLEHAYPSTNDGWGAALLPVFPLNKALRPAVVVLLGAVGCVLLIACINVAGLLLVRAGVRQREIATRAALGASRGRLVRQMLAESALLASLGGAAGVVLAVAGLRLLAPLVPQFQIARSASMTVDGRVLVFTLAATALTALALGVAPALRAIQTGSLRVSAASTRRAMPRALLAIEMSLSLVLLVGAALLIRTLWNLQRVDPGFRGDHLLTMQLWLPPAKYTTRASTSGFYEEVLGRLRSHPEIREAAVSNTRPFLGWSLGARLSFPGRPPDAKELLVDFRVISDRYFAAIGAPLVRGRFFSSTDGPDGAAVALVNDAMAHRYWPGEDVLGKTVEVRSLAPDGTAPWSTDLMADTFTIVGVVGDVKESQLNEHVRPLLYVSSRQTGTRYANLLVRTEIPPAGATSLAQREIRAVDPNLGVYGAQTMETVLDEAVAAPRLNSVLLWVFALLALVMSAVGVYGVMSYAVAQRTREFAIRVAMGAESRSLFAMITREGLAIATAGIVIGLAGVLLLARALRALLYGVAPTDAATIAASIATVLVVALAACWRPAWSASRVDPMQVLRCE
jgi:putative ABC transport system permease protein